MTQRKLELISHQLCPYVQRSVITLIEKNIEHKRTYINLNNKPRWFTKLSPTGLVPLLIVNEEINIFESSAICEYIDEITPGALHPSAPEDRASHRGWIEFASNTLNNIARLYKAKTQKDLMHEINSINERFKKINSHIIGPYFFGKKFTMVDAAFGPVFRYFDVFDSYLPTNSFKSAPAVTQWRKKLSQRNSIQQSVNHDYSKNLKRLVISLNGVLGTSVKQHSGELN